MPGLSYWTFTEWFIWRELRHAGTIVGVREKDDVETLLGLEVGITVTL